MLEKIDRLIVLAGPSCSGKSFFLDKLLAGDLPHLTGQLDIGDLNSWLLIESNRTETINDKIVPQVLLHYALPSIEVYDGSFSDFADDARLSVLHLAREITFLTLYVDPATLRTRAEQRKHAFRRNYLQMASHPVRYMKRYHRIKQLDQLYSEPEKLLSVYSRWFSYCQSLEAKAEWIVQADGMYPLQPAHNWREVTKAWGQTG